MNLLIYSLDAIAALCALGGVAMLVFLPIALLGDFSVGLAIAVGALIFGVAAVSVFRYGNSERATWLVRLSAPVGLGLLIWIGGMLVISVELLDPGQ